MISMLKSYRDEKYVCTLSCPVDSCGGSSALSSAANLSFTILSFASQTGMPFQIIVRGQGPTLGANVSS